MLRPASADQAKDLLLIYHYTPMIILLLGLVLVRDMFITSVICKVEAITTILPFTDFYLLVLRIYPTHYFAPERIPIILFHS